MAMESNDTCEHDSSLLNEPKEEQALDGIDERTKTARHPRWTRQETVVLIQAKKVVENRIREFRRSTSTSGTDQSEPKWDSVASYCKQNGVNRRPVQCRKRWGNLLVDYKKIKIWESNVKEERDSFWVMRNDLRKEMKLPSYFDREVYDVLDGVYAMPAIPLTLVTTTSEANGGQVYEIVEVAEEEEDEEEKHADAIFDSSRNTAAEDGLFSDNETSQQPEIFPSPEKEKTARKNTSKKVATQLHITDTVKEKLPGASTCNGSTSQERWKRRRLSSHVSKDTDTEDLLIKVLERNSGMLNAQLEAQNINCQLDREQKKEHSDNLIAAVNNLTDALLRIADKLEEKAM